MLGLACRAGQLTTGAELALQKIRAGSAALALMDAEASENTRKRIADACAYRNVPLFVVPGGLLDQASGKEGRMAAVMPRGDLATKIKKMLSEAGDSSSP